MAFNTSDTRQRAYNPIDTSNPGGTWIDEKAFNKTRPGDGKKVLCGNWQEERILEGDMMSQGIPVGTVREDGVRFRGGFETSPYLTVAVDPKERRPGLNTTQRVSYTSTNGDVKSQLQPALGVRAAARNEQVLALAKESLAASQEQRNALSLSGSFVKGATLKSTYQEHHGQDEVKREVTEVRQDFVHETPITLYTGNPTTGKVMYVHGKTAENPAASTIHAKHSAFTDEKYTIGSL